MYRHAPFSLVREPVCLEFQSPLFRAVTAAWFRRVHCCMCPCFATCRYCFCMQFRRRSVLGDSIRSAHHVMVWWYCLCRILLGSLCLNVNEESSIFLRTLRANKLVCNDVFLTCFPPCDVQFYARFAVPVL